MVPVAHSGPCRHGRLSQRSAFTCRNRSPQKAIAPCSAKQCRHRALQLHRGACPSLADEDTVFIRYRARRDIAARAAGIRRPFIGPRGWLRILIDPKALSTRMSARGQSVSSSSCAPAGARRCGPRAARIGGSSPWPIIGRRVQGVEGAGAPVEMPNRTRRAGSPAAESLRAFRGGNLLHRFFDLAAASRKRHCQGFPPRPGCRGFSVFRQSRLHRKSQWPMSFSRVRPQGAIEGRANRGLGLPKPGRCGGCAFQGGPPMPATPSSTASRLNKLSLRPRGWVRRRTSSASIGRWRRLA